MAREKALSRKETQKIIKGARKSQRQEIEELVRYPALKFVIQFAKIFGIILLAICWVIAVVQLFIADGFGEALFYFFLLFTLGIIYFIVGWCMGDYMQLQIDIEENTRKK